MTALAAAARQGGDPKGIRAQHDRAAAKAATPNLSSGKPHKSCGQGAAINLSDSGPQKEQSMTDVEAIVGKLTKAQREAILDAQWHGSGPLGPMHFATVKFTDPWTVPVAEFLTLRTDRLTPLGLAVRTYLLKDKTR